MSFWEVSFSVITGGIACGFAAFIVIMLYDSFCPTFPEEWQRNQQNAAQIKAAAISALGGCVIMLMRDCAR